MFSPTSLTMKGILFLFAASHLWEISDSSFLDCEEHPKCLLEGFDDDAFCCPDLNGVYQDCCHRAECVVYPACYGVGVEGFCCPTVEGNYLDCCNDPANKAAPSLPPSQIPSSYPTLLIITANEVPASCSRNAQCEAIGLEGLCCPTEDDVTLDCCDDVPTTVPLTAKPSSAPSMNPSSSPSEVAISAQCSAHPTCTSLGVNGQCCPTLAGVQLDCCGKASGTIPTSPPTSYPSSSPSKNPTSSPTTSPSSSPSQSPTASSGPAQCSASPGCASLGIEGECCPTSTGVQLDCCDQAASTIPTSPPTKTPSSSPSKNPTSSPTTSPSSSPSQLPTASSGPAQCSASPGCASLGIEGECCPTSTGVQLDCCDQAASTIPTSPPTKTPSSSPTIQPECSANQECLALGLTGLCCPTPDDVMVSIPGLILKKWRSSVSNLACCMSFVAKLLLRRAE
jgi:hypothetical protein